MDKRYISKGVCKGLEDGRGSLLGWLGEGVHTITKSVIGICVNDLFLGKAFQGSA